MKQEETLQDADFVSWGGQGGFGSLQMSSSLYGSLLERDNDASAAHSGWSWV